MKPGIQKQKSWPWAMQRERCSLLWLGCRLWRQAQTTWHCRARHVLGFTATPPAEARGQWLLLPQPAAACQVPPGLQRAAVVWDQDQCHERELGEEAMHCTEEGSVRVQKMGWVWCQHIKKIYSRCHYKPDCHQYLANNPSPVRLSFMNLVVFKFPRSGRAESIK